MSLPLARRVLLLVLATVAVALTFSWTGRVAVASQAQGTWSPVIGWPFVPIHMHILPTGNVLAWSRDKVTGTNTDVDNQSKAWIWDPLADNFLPVDNAWTNLFCSGHAFLPDGRLFVTGGHDGEDHKGEAHTNIFNSSNNSWTAVTAMPNGGRWYPTTVQLGNGEVLTISGTNASHAANTVPEVWTTAGTWRPLTGINKGFANYPMMHLLPDGKVFMAGPTETGIVDPAGTGIWTPLPGGVPNRTNGTSVMYRPGKIIKIGGDGAPDSAERIDFTAPFPAWQPAASPQFARTYPNATILPDGKVLLTGGGTSNSWSRPAEVWDPDSNTWTTWASPIAPRLYHSVAVLLPDGRVLSGGGGLPFNVLGYNQNEQNVEFFSPPYLHAGLRPTITDAPEVITYGQPFRMMTGAPLTGGSVTLLGLGSVTHAFNMGQRFNKLTYTTNPDTSLNVTGPANGNIAPPGYYMLFALNSNGVPSAAKIVKLIAPDIQMNIDAPAASPPVMPVFGVGGWAFDRNSTTGTGVDFIDIWVVPVSPSGSGIYAGRANMNVPRSDVVQAFNLPTPQFAATGFDKQILLTNPGQYNAIFYPGSSMDGAIQFSAAKSVLFNVAAGPAVVIDLPSGPSSGSPFNIAGWALDSSVQKSTGITAVHIWVQSASGTTFLGAAQYGGSRPDVDSAFGGTGQFTPSGYSLTGIQLAAGQYTLYAYALNGTTVRNAATRTITIN